MSSDIRQLPVQDHPTEHTQTWPTLDAALDSAQSDAIFVRTGIPVAFRDDDRWIVDDEALHCVAGQRWLSHLAPADAALIQLLIWPVGAAGWVGEVGSNKNIRPLGEMFETMTDAVEAVIADIRLRRDELVNVLMTGGPLTARLATTRERWEQPSIEVYINETQQNAWLVHVPA